MTKSRKLGVHTSIAGGIHLSVKRAYELGCNTMQIFSHNPRGWIKKWPDEEEVKRFKDLSKKYKIEPLFIHASYLINLSSPDRTVRRQSIELLSYELKIAEMLSARYIILHPGRTVGQDLNVAIKKASDAISRASEEAESYSRILLENTAGRKGDISSSMPLISEIITKTAGNCIGGICLDTCHVFSAGYDIRNTEGIERLRVEIDLYLSPLKVRLIHLNDSKRDAGSRIDRHEHIGEGYIGKEGFKNLLSDEYFRDIPIILETPKLSDNDDRKNLERVRTIIQEIDGSPRL